MPATTTTTKASPMMANKLKPLDELLEVAASTGFAFVVLSSSKLEVVPAAAALLPPDKLPPVLNGSVLVVVPALAA